MMDTAKLFPIVLAVNIIHGFTLFIAITLFPVAFASLAIYGLALNSVRDTSRYLNLVYIAFILDLITIIFLRLVFLRSHTLAPLALLPLGILVVLYIYLIRLSGEELKLFGRTIQSLNEEDRELARKAKKSHKREDISQVASYKSWREL